jgi:phosphoribosyl-AMP cyclohydrolase
MLDGWECGGDALSIGDLSGLLVLGDIEVDADEDALAREGEILDRFFCHGGL